MRLEDVEVCSMGLTISYWIYFYNRKFVCIPFFLMHALKDTIMDVREKSRKGEIFTILYQGLMFRLYQFHLALYHPRVMAIENLQPIVHPLHLDFGSGIQAPTPSQSPSKKRKTEP